MDAQFRFDDISQADLQHHIHHLAEVGADNARAELLIKEINLILPVIVNTYKSKPKTISLLIRSGSVGRESLESLHDWMKSEGLTLQVRKSAKRKLVSQLKVKWECSNDLYALEVISALGEICTRLGSSWPTALAMGYYPSELKPGLPGTVSSTSILWNAGHKFGKAIGKILS